MQAFKFTLSTLDMWDILQVAEVEQIQFTLIEHGTTTVFTESVCHLFDILFYDESDVYSVDNFTVVQWNKSGEVMMHNLTDGESVVVKFNLYDLFFKPHYRKPVDLWNNGIQAAIQLGYMTLCNGQWVKCGYDDEQLSRFISFNHTTGYFNVVHGWNNQEVNRKFHLANKFKADNSRY